MSAVFSLIRPYLFSVLAVFLALAAKSVLQPYLSTSPPFITFLAAIMFVSWAWGLLPAVFTTLLSALVIDYSLIPPVQSFGLSPADFASVLFFCAVALTMAYTIDRLQIRQREAIRLQRQLERLHQLTTRLYEETDAEKTLGSILTITLELLDADKGLIQLYDAQDKMLVLTNQVGFSEEFCRRFTRIPLDFSSPGAAFRNRQRVIIENVATDSEFSKLASLFPADHVVSAQSTPLLNASGEALGVLTTYSPKPHIPSTQQLHLFDLFAQRAGRILEARQHQEMLSEENEDLEHHISAIEQRLEQTLSELAITEERERHNLATELHDYLAQLLAFANLKLHSAQILLKSSPEKSEQSMQQTAVALQRAMVYTRTLMAELVPPELHSSGLPAALRWLAAQMSKHGLAVHTDMNVGSIDLTHDQRALLYKSVRELLINVVKHAETDQATISLTVDADQTLLVVVDDRGRGYDRSEVKLSNVGSNFGLASVRERMSALGGWCREESAVGLGTTITLGLPLQRDEQVGSLRAASSRPQDRVKATPTGPVPQEDLPFDSSLGK